MTVYDCPCEERCGVFRSWPYENVHSDNCFCRLCGVERSQSKGRNK